MTITMVSAFILHGLAKCRFKAPDRQPIITDRQRVRAMLPLTVARGFLTVALIGIVTSLTITVRVLLTMLAVLTVYPLPSGCPGNQ